MKKQIRQVQEFMEAMGDPVAHEPTLITPEKFKLRYDLGMEELDEYFSGCFDPALDSSEKIEAIADALVDQAYILMGTILKHGLQDKFEALFDEVHRTNMSKMGPDGKPIKREDGKFLKPEGWKPPQIGKILAE